MNLTKLTDNLNNVSSLPDKPVLDSDELKEVFDKAGNSIKHYINEVLTDEIEKLISNSIENAKLIVENNLTSTSAVNALSAQQGKVLNDKITGTVLHKNETGTMEKIDLLEASTNFYKITIIYRDMYGVYDSVDIYNPDGKSAKLTSIRNGSQAIVIMNAIISFSGKSLTWDSSKRYSLATGEYVDEPGGIAITEIIGYKEV